MSIFFIFFFLHWTNQKATVNREPVNRGRPHRPPALLPSHSEVPPSHPRYTPARRLQRLASAARSNSEGRRGLIGISLYPSASSRAPMTTPRCAHAACLSWRCARRHARHCARGCWVWVGYGGGSVARGGSLDWVRGRSLYTNIYSVMYGVVRFCPNPRPGLLAE